MSDLQKRLGELDRLDTPDMRAAIEQRAARLRAEPTTPVPGMLPGVSTWRGTLIAIGTATVIVVMAVATVWLVGGGTGDVATEPATGVGDGQTVGVTLSGVSGHDGHDLAGVLYAGELTDLDRDALGGFWWVVSDEDFTAVVRQPGGRVGRFPHVSSQALTVEPGTYTLVIWVDTALNSATRWVPVNTDGQGLYGCHAVFEVGEDTQTNIEITPNLHPDGWNIDCATGEAIPGTDAGAAVNPRGAFDPWGATNPWGETSMPPVAGVGDGQTVGVTVSGVSGHDGHELAGVLYAGELTDLDRDALGGFWSVVSDEDFTAVIRQPADMVGRFPHVSSQALTVEPGTYTLVIWVDFGLGPATRWVPVNTDGQGLYGCHAVFEVGGDTQTNIEITPNLHPDGWNIDCATGEAIPGTDAGAAVNPRGAFDPWGATNPWGETSMPPVVDVGDGQTVGVTVSGVSGHDGHELAGVLYAGELTDLDRDALGGFWSVVSDEDFTAVIRQPADMVGRFPYVSDQALTVEPGTYTLVIWVDFGLGPATRWVPVNTDGQGLYGCHAVFEVGGDTQTNIEITPNLHPDGWNINCTTP